MDDLISRELLYNKAVKLEKEAQERVTELSHRGTFGDFRIWSAILTERTAFKFDVQDAPSAEHIGYWRKKNDWLVGYNCNICGEHIIDRTKYCPNCGARMKGEEE